jgi:hypothetical protein
VATVSKAANAHAVVATGWTSPSNAYSTTGDNVYAVGVAPKSATLSGDFGFPDITSADIPDGSTINSVTVVTEANLSAAVTGGTYGVQPMKSGANAGTETTKTTTTEAVVSATFTGVTLTDLRSASSVIKARCRSSKGNTNTAMQVNLDYVRLDIDYTAAGPQTHQLSATVTGSGSSSPGGSLRARISASPAGSGSVTAAAGRRQRVTAAVTGAGSLTGAAIARRRLVATLAGDGAIVGTAALRAAMTAAAAGAGSVLPAARARYGLAGAPNGSGSVSAALGRLIRIAAGLSGSGVLSPALRRRAGLSAAMLGSGSVAGTLSGLAILHELAAGLAGTGSVAGTAARRAAIASALSGGGALADASVAARFYLVGQLLGAGNIAGAVAVLGDFPGSIDLTSGLHADSCDADGWFGDSVSVTGDRSGSAALG